MLYGLVLCCTDLYNVVQTCRCIPKECTQTEFQLRTQTDGRTYIRTCWAASSQLKIDTALKSSMDVKSYRSQSLNRRKGTFCGEFLAGNSGGKFWWKVLVGSSGRKFSKGYSSFKKASCLGDKLQENQNIILPADYVKRNEWNEVFALFPNILFYCQWTGVEHSLEDHWWSQ